MLTMDRVIVDESELAPRSLGEYEAQPCIRCRAPRILVAEDDDEMRALLASVLRGDGYDVTEVSDGLGLLHRLMYSKILFGDESGFDLIISDIRMPDITGLDFLAGMQDDEYIPPVILITAFGDMRTHAEAERLGAMALFDKPLDMDDFRVAVRGALAALVMVVESGPTWSSKPDPLSTS